MSAELRAPAAGVHQPALPGSWLVRAAAGVPKECPGSGRRWIPGMGRAICPVCHRSSRALGLAVDPRRLLDRPRKHVPDHELRA